MFDPGINCFPLLLVVGLAAVPAVLVICDVQGIVGSNMLVSIATLKGINCQLTRFRNRMNVPFQDQSGVIRFQSMLQSTNVT